MKQHILLVLLLLALGLSACGAAAPAAPEQSFAPAEPAPPASAGAPGLDQGKATEGEAQEIARDQSQAEGVQRLVIKTAALMLEVENVRDAENAIRAKVAELNGYIVTAQSIGTDEDTYIDLVFRVPSDKFDTALSGVQGLATKVLSRGLGGEDVTEEFVDLDSRLRNLEATRERLLDLLTKAEKVEDALAVNQALTDVQGQIEQIKGRMKYLQQSAAMATISVSLRPVPPEPTIVEEDSWQPVRVFRSALRDLVEFGQGLANLGIVLLVWSPLWLVLFLVGRWGWKKLTSGRKPKTPADPTPPTPTTPTSAE
jgi:Domain of unknown function (DUF4349)